MPDSNPTPPDHTAPADSRGRERVLRFQSLAKGASFAGRYDIVGPIGSGGSGEVFEAFDRTAQQVVAIKVLFPGGGNRDLERLRRELRVVRGLTHPGIVRVHDIGEADGLFYIVSELLQGETLAQRLRKRRRLTPEEAERILRDVLDALGHAHAKGIIHRDVKPANIFLVKMSEDRERVVLLDFGLARETSATGLTATGKFVGTPEYSAPEQIRGVRELGPATDLYAVGVTLWEMLAGAPPFVGNSDVEVLAAHLSRPLPVMGPEMAAVPANLRALLVRLLEKDSTRRLPSADHAVHVIQGSRASIIRALLGARWSAANTRHRWVRTLLIVIVAALPTIAGIAWLASPVRVDPDGNRVAWTTRAGFRWRSEPFAHRVVAACLLPRHFGLEADAVIALAGTPWNKPGTTPILLLRVDYWGGRKHPLWTPNDQSQYLGTTLYAFQSPAYGLHQVVPLPRSIPGSDDALVVMISHVSEYPNRVLIQSLRPNGRGQRYEHPGSVQRVVALSRSDGKPGLAVFTGFNNLMGPRPAAFALTLDATADGQSPPYTAIGRMRDTARWYLPLPYDVSTDPETRVHGSIASISMPGRVDFRFDVRGGIPLDPSDRGGLSEKAWSNRRRQLFDALFVSQAESQMGRYASAADHVEATMSGPSAGTPLDVIVRYWAAIYRLKEARAGDPASAHRAVVHLERALALEPGAARILLLLAEAQIRLGQREAAAATLRRFWQTATPEMYRYEWVLLNWLAGEKLTLSEALGELTFSPLNAWAAQIRVCHGVLYGDLPAARAATSMPDPEVSHRDEFFLWSALAWTYGADSDLAKARHFLRQGRREPRGGIDIPWDRFESAIASGRPELVRGAPRTPILKPGAPEPDWSYRGVESLVFAALLSPP